MNNYWLVDGIWRPAVPVVHREEDYTSASFERLREMERRHFWYQGRYRFLAEAVRRHLGLHPRRNRKRPIQKAKLLRAIDIGGGCGGWIERFARLVANWGTELAIGDSSPKALQLARVALPPAIELYHLDCMNLGWAERWDVIFLLDVLEHLADDGRAMAELARALAPGGLLFVTVPALRAFWTYNDEWVGHRRRYSRADLARLARENGLTLCDARYFMFLLSPLLVGGRWLGRPRRQLSAEEAAAHLARTHRVPAGWLNALLGAVFALETPLGHWLRFPWGTSLLGVFEKPENVPCSQTNRARHAR